MCTSASKCLCLTVSDIRIILQLTPSRRLFQKSKRHSIADMTSVLLPCVIQPEAMCSDSDSDSDPSVQENWNAERAQGPVWKTMCAAALGLKRESV